MSSLGDFLGQINRIAALKEMTQLQEIALQRRSKVSKTTRTQKQLMESQAGEGNTEADKQSRWYVRAQYF